MEDMDSECHEHELISRTSYLLRLYRKRTQLQQLLQQYEIQVKSACGMLLLVYLLSCGVKISTLFHMTPHLRGWNQNIERSWFLEQVSAYGLSRSLLSVLFVFFAFMVISSSDTGWLMTVPYHTTQLDLEPSSPFLSASSVFYLFLQGSLVSVQMY